MIQYEYTSITVPYYEWEDFHTKLNDAGLAGWEAWHLHPVGFDHTKEYAYVQEIQLRRIIPASDT